MPNNSTVKPSWLNALNKEQPLAPTAEVLQEPASMEVGEDESVAALPKYNTPPPLDLTPKAVSETTSSTMLPFPFDAEAFGKPVMLPERDGMPDGMPDGSIIEFKTTLPNVVSDQKAIKPGDIIASHMDTEKVTQTGQRVLKDVISMMPKEVLDEYQELLNKPTDSIFQQEFTHGSPELDADAAKLDAMFRECSSGPTMPNKGVLFFDDKGMNPSLKIVNSIRHDESSIEECDCVGTENQITIKVPKDLEPGSYTCQLNDKLEMVIVMPFMPNEEALLPEPKIGLGGREVLSSETWLGLMMPTESIAFDNHIALVMQSNSLHAAHLIRLKGFKSKYLQAIITTPEMAEEHIRVAIGRGEDPGGWDNSDHRRIKQAQALIARGFASKAKSESRLRFKQYVLKVRDKWKETVKHRAEAMERWNVEVSNQHEAFKIAKNLSFDEYMAIYESGEL